MAIEPSGPADDVVRLRRADLAELLSRLGEPQIALVSQFVRQILRCHDPDVVATFLNWRRDPRIETLLLIAAGLDDEALDQLVFAAEALQDEPVLRDPWPPVGVDPPQRR